MSTPKSERLLGPLHNLAVLLFAACIAMPAQAGASDFSLTARRTDFKTFCERFPDNYAWTDQPEKPWQTWETRYAPAVDAASTPAAYAAVLESALDELHDFHAEVRAPDPHRWLPVPTFADIWAELRGTNAVIIAIRGGSDAERSGLVVGDRILAISDVPLNTALADRLRPAASNSGTRAREWALLSLLTGRADQERRLSVQTRDGQTRSVVLPRERHFDRPPGLLSSDILPGNFGIIRFNNSLGDQKTVDAFDAALERLRSARGLILDLRDVPSGGNSSVALGIMGRFVTTMLPYQRHRIPKYGQPDVERNWLELVAPRGPFTYTAPVVVLVDHWTGSMGEGVAIGFDAMHRALVIGTPMAHLAGAVSDFILPLTGMDIAIATEQIYHINGTPRQDWNPPILIENKGTGDDLILKRGLSELQRSVTDPTKQSATSGKAGGLR
jgi:C-terminal processing protease CtpA/Prc